MRLDCLLLSRRLTLVAHGVGHAGHPPLEDGATGGPADRLLAHAVPQAGQRVPQLQRAAHGAPLRGLGRRGSAVGRPVGRRLRLDGVLGRQPLGRGDADHDARGGDFGRQLVGAGRVHLHVCVVLSFVFTGVVPLWQLRRLLLLLLLHLVRLRLRLLVGARGAFGPGGRLGDGFLFSNQVQRRDGGAAQVAAPSLGQPGRTQTRACAQKRTTQARKNKKAGPTCV